VSRHSPSTARTLRTKPATASEFGFTSVSTWISAVVPAFDIAMPTRVWYAATCGVYAALPGGVASQLAASA
jgi:hypothetical protein